MPNDPTVFDAMPEAFRLALASLHAGESQRGVDGRMHPIDATTRIAPEEGEALFRLTLDGPLQTTLEIGLAYGFSTAYLLAAHASRGAGDHTAVDPYQYTDWNGIGATSAAGLVEDSGVEFTLIEERSEVALIDLTRAGRRFGLVFIDGYHRFDDVLVDFTVAAPLVPIGGAIVLHDMWLGSIDGVAAFVRANRSDFLELETGCENLFAVRRVGHDERDWSHFEPFATRREGGISQR